ncbi:MAG TPA: hypothetical protein VJ802_13795 [Gemmatimonadaceae bacterium]|nr:hypothetical protein [Gemmatimonadaceae bacterium]
MTHLRHLAFVLALVACSDPHAPDRAVGPIVLNVTPFEASPGDLVTVDMHLPDAQGPLRVLLEFSGVIEASDTLDVPEGIRDVTGQFTVPAPLPDGPLTLSVAIVSESGQIVSARSSKTIAVRDIIPPIPDAVVRQYAPYEAHMVAHDVSLIAGSTVDVNIRATDNNYLTWIGYALGPPANVRDSVRVSAASINEGPVLRLVVPNGWAGTAPAMKAFARDLSGVLGEQDMGSAPVYRFIERPMRTLATPSASDEAVYDEARDVLYVSQPASRRVAVVDVSTMTERGAVDLPARPASIDLTPSGDTLLVALEGSVYLGIVDVRTAPYSVDTLRVHYSAAIGHTGPFAVNPWVGNVRVAADGRAIISLSTSVRWQTDQVVVLDLATGSQTIVYSGWRDEDIPLVRTPDRKWTHLFGASTTESVYDAVGHRFVALPSGPAERLWKPLSMSADARYFMSGSHLYDAQVRHVREIGITGYVSGQTRISNAGTAVYASASRECWPFNYPTCEHAGEPSYLLRYAVPSGDLLEMIRTPQLGRPLLVLPGDTAVLLSGPSLLMLLDFRGAGTALSALSGGALPPPNAVSRPESPAIADRATPVVRLRVQHGRRGQ